MYGDPQRTATLHDVLLAWEEQAQRWAGADDRNGPSCDELRALLIQLGQVVQAAEDAQCLPDECLFPLTSALLCVALAFLQSGKKVISTWLFMGADCLKAARFGAGEQSQTPLTIKTPEGYAFYTLYPEQYIEAAWRWLAERKVPLTGQSTVHVVGVRSIGTSLAAVVYAALRETWKTTYRTVRPHGPYEARVADVSLSFSAGRLRRDWAIVVDEGPGLSGSSMASVADALCRAGIKRDRIAFFPGHGGDPMQLEQSKATQKWWTETPRYVVPLSEMRWDGLTLTETLAKQALELLGESAPLESVTVEDGGGGLWRRWNYVNEIAWPASAVAFERSKYRCTTPRGNRVLWKFAGLGQEIEVFAEQIRRFKKGWATEPLGTCLGFLGTRWVAGEPLTLADREQTTLELVGRYMADVAGPSLPGEEQTAAWTRLGEMLYWNVWEGVGEAEAQTARALFDRAEAENRAALRPAYGDGRLAPCEWIRNSDNHIYKMDATGHDQDHTVVGRQPVEWDIAGALVEWELWQGDEPASGAKPLLAAVKETGTATDGPLLLAYVLAYSAFRLGLLTMCNVSLPVGDAEQRRLQAATKKYADVLCHTLQCNS